MHSTMLSNNNATQHASATHVLGGQLAAQGARLLVTQVGGQVPKKRKELRVDVKMRLIALIKRQKKDGLKSAA